MFSWICCAAFPDCSANFRTSWATTANPRPLSPARAASIAAFKAKRLVCSAIVWIIARKSVIPFSLLAKLSKEVLVLLIVFLFEPINWSCLIIAFFPSSTLAIVMFITSLTWAKPEAASLRLIFNSSNEEKAFCTFSAISVDPAAISLIATAIWLVTSAVCLLISFILLLIALIFVLFSLTISIIERIFSIKALIPIARLLISSLPLRIICCVKSPPFSAISSTFWLIVANLRLILREIIIAIIIAKITAATEIPINK